MPPGQGPAERTELRSSPGCEAILRPVNKHQDKKEKGRKALRRTELPSITDLHIRGSRALPDSRDRRVDSILIFSTPPKSAGISFWRLANHIDDICSRLAGKMRYTGTDSLGGRIIYFPATVLYSITHIRYPCLQIIFRKPGVCGENPNSAGKLSRLKNNIFDPLPFPCNRPPRIYYSHSLFLI